MGLPLRTLCLLIPTCPLLWPHFTPLFMPYLYLKSPPASVLQPLDLQSMCAASFTLPPLFFHAQERAGGRRRVVSVYVCGQRKEFIQQLFGFFFFFYAHHFWFNIWSDAAGPTWRGVFCNSCLCASPSVCMQTCLQYRCGADRPPAASLFIFLTNKRRVCVDDLVSVELITAAQLLQPHTDYATYKRLKTSHHTTGNVCRLTY